MLYYGMSLIGSSHIKKGSICQDASKAQKLINGWVVAAVADGVGSAKHSDIASKIAVDTVIQICNDRISKHTKMDELKSIILDAYKAAEKSIEDYVENQKDTITEYDTTLSMVVFDGQKIVYGHSGDGGIVGLTNDGKYIKITSPQKAEDNVCVIPLRAGENSWVIDECNEKLASVLLATDGVYDTFFPYLLKGQQVEIYVPLVRYFMDNNCLMANENNISEIENRIKEYLQSDAYGSVTDDKTVMVVINPKIMPTFQDEQYYAEPDWNKLQLEWNKKAYPHLYKDLDDEAKSEQLEDGQNVDDNVKG